jgi:predicted Zn-dependent peptidase
MGVDPDKLPAMKRLLRETLDGLLSDPPSQQEVDEARNHLLGRYVSAAQSNRELADELARQWFWFGHPLEDAELRQRLDSVKRQDVVNLLPAFARGSTVVIRNPSGTKPPD